MEPTQQRTDPAWLAALTHVAAALAGAAVAVTALLTGAPPREHVRTVQIPVRIPVAAPAPAPAPAAAPPVVKLGPPAADPSGVPHKAVGVGAVHKARHSPVPAGHEPMGPDSAPLFRPPVALHPLLLPPLKLVQSYYGHHHRAIAPPDSGAAVPARPPAPQDAASPLVRALEAADRGDLDTAIGGLGKLTAAFPSDPALALLLANLYDQKRVAAATPDEEARWRRQAMAERDRALALLEVSQHPELALPPAATTPSSKPGAAPPDSSKPPAVGSTGASPTPGTASSHGA